MIKDGLLDAEMVDFLIMSDETVSERPATLWWLPLPAWYRVKFISKFTQFRELPAELEEGSEMWRRWFDEQRPETVPCPAGSMQKLKSFHRLLILRAMRPDRLLDALTAYIGATLGEDYVTEPPFDMEATWRETSRSTPIFFVLFPGVDPTLWVEALGKKFGKTISNGMFVNISMGEGQEAPAALKMDELASKGGWIMMQNVHLMQEWLPVLERHLELLSEHSHDDFRVFLSAEPPSFSYQKIIPESLLQTSIKVANEVPADMKSNLRRAWANFSQEWIDECPKDVNLKGCLFTLCFYHALVQGRRRFGQQGWSKKYSFNVGDLTVCAQVLKTWIGRSDKVPWTDVKYILAGIMYGGHITDYWDRRCNTVYLDVLLQEQIFKGIMLAPGFRAPDPKTKNYLTLDQYILEKLPRDSPPMFRMHPNAEIGYLSTASTALFQTIMVLEKGGGGGGGEGGGGGDAALIAKIDSLMEQMPPSFNEVEIRLRATLEVFDENAEHAPYVLVVLQEIRRMNRLTKYMSKTMGELKKGMNGELNMSPGMEELQEALVIDQVPGRNIFHQTSWEAIAWPSKRPLTGWFKDTLYRIAQLELWAEHLVRPNSTWIPALFNPMAFLTALMQVTGRQRSLPLDNMSIETHLTIFPSKCTSLTFFLFFFLPV